MSVMEEAGNKNALVPINTDLKGREPGVSNAPVVPPILSPNQLQRNHLPHHAVTKCLWPLYWLYRCMGTTHLLLLAPVRRLSSVSRSRGGSEMVHLFRTSTSYRIAVRDLPHTMFAQRGTDFLM